MNIALVDDLPRELSRLSKILNEYASENHVSMELHTFHSAEDFLADYRPYQYTLIFLDIYMDGMSGIEASKQLRQTDTDTPIVFLTTSSDHMFDAFGVHAFDFILKVPDQAVLKDSVYKVLKDIRSLLGTECAKLMFLYDRKEYSLSYDRIEYVQSDKNNVLIMDNKANCYRPHMTFSQVCGFLEADSRFLRINRGILINMDYITAFEKEVCELKGGHCLPVSVREHKKLDQLRRNYIFSKLHQRKE